MEESDGVIFACPNYAFHVPARMKNLLDRMAFCFHRPRFFGKTFTSVVTQGVCGGRTVRKYLESSAKDFGFSTTRGCCMTTLEPLTERQEKDLKRKTRKAAERFYHELCQPAKAPSVFRLMMFRVARMRVKRISKTFYDYGYYEKQGCGSHPITISTSLWGQERKPWGNFSTS
jgi:hypothetical protein